MTEFRIGCVCPRCRTRKKYTSGGCVQCARERQQARRDQGKRGRGWRVPRKSKYGWTVEDFQWIVRHWHRCTPEATRARFPHIPYQRIVERAWLLGVHKKTGSRCGRSPKPKWPLLRALRKIRIDKGIQQTVLGKKMGYCPQQLSRCETGISLPSFPMLMAWCEALGVTLYPWTTGDPLAKSFEAKQGDVFDDDETQDVAWRNQIAPQLAA